MEAFLDKKLEVLLFTDPVDEWVMGSYRAHSGFSFKSAASQVDLRFFADQKEDEHKEHADSSSEHAFLNALADTLKEKVKRVVASSRLTESPCCLTQEDNNMSLYMESLMISAKQMNDDAIQKRTLELNLSHPFVQRTKNIWEKNPEQATDFFHLLYDMAMMSGGGSLCQHRSIYKTCVPSTWRKQPHKGLNIIFKNIPKEKHNHNFLLRY